MEDSDSLGDLELGEFNVKLTFDELRQQLLKEPTKITKNPALCRTLFHYCKDTKKHGRIIRFLFWPIIMSLVQDKKHHKISLFGLRAFNQLLTCEGSLAAVIQAGKAAKLQTNPRNNISKIIQHFQQEDEEEDHQDGDKLQIETGKKDHASKEDKNAKMLNEFIAKRQNPILILVAKLLKDANSFQIMQECSKAIRNLAQSPEVIRTLHEEGMLIEIIKEKYLHADPFTQENILETVSFACKFPEYRQSFANDQKVIDILLSQVQSISLKVTYFTIKICRRLSKDKASIKKLQGNNLRLTEKLIVAFKWLDKKRETELRAEEAAKNETVQEDEEQAEDDQAADEGQQQNDIYSLVFCEISKSFQYILKYYETHKVLLDLAQKQEKGKNLSIETDIIETIVNLGRQTKDPQTQLNAATCLAHITEVLHCNPEVAHRGLEFMIDMLKDAKNLKHYRQGCRYFANLSFYKDFRDELIEKDIGRYLLNAIERQPDSDTIKHSAIALANLSSHKNFMKVTGPQKDGSNTQDGSNPKQEKQRIKPLIHLLDSAQEHKINLIQSACITLCNMASKPKLHTHFIHEPEISTIKNCLSNPIDKDKGNELIRFMIKLVCNLTKNPEMLPHLARKGFLEDLFVLLDHEKQKEIFGNVVTAICYLSNQKDCQHKIIKRKIIPRILEPLTQITEVDQKMIIIALTSMLFNGIDVQREFIKHGGLGKLLFFMQQKDKIFQQLACKCFSLLSENQQNLQEILDQECLNTIIISCLRTKDIDLETLKEITKIFINLILWRKISKNTFETTCCLCDIGLMIDDQDMNILAIFCLNALSENEESHSYIRESGVSFSINTLGKNAKIKASDEQEGSHDGDDESEQANEKVKRDYNGQSLFNRINFLLEYQDYQQKGTDQSDKQSLIVTLITSFYLNLARNEENIHFLLKLKLFQQLNRLMQSPLLQNNSDSTALCYTNTIFSKLLKSPEALEHCVLEEGYELFISILKGQQQQNRHLFLETLDSIKLFLSKREYLSKFKAIPDHAILDDEYPDLTVSFLQVLAILSFEKENHERLKSQTFLAKLTGSTDGKSSKDIKAGIFGKILTDFESMDSNREAKSKKGDESQIVSARFGMQRDSDQIVEPGLEEQRGGGAMYGNPNRATVYGRGRVVNRRNRIRDNQNKNRAEELALAVSIILANLSCDREFLKILLEVDEWEPVKPNEKDESAKSEAGPSGGIMDADDLEGPDEDEVNNEDTLAVFEKKMKVQQAEMVNGNFNFVNDLKEQTNGQYQQYDDEALKVRIPVQRITKFFNLLSHDNIYISEQIAILLANVSNSPYFRHIFITDRCMKSLLVILRDQNYDQVARVSQLAALIVVLNLTSMNDIVLGLENMKFMQTLQEIIKDERLPNVNKSIALLAISNIQTVGKRVMTQINPETKDFAFRVLLYWRKILDEEGESIEVVKNLVYASLILFYNLILKKVGSASTINHLINNITEKVLDFEDDQIINVVLELVTLFTRKKETSDYILQKQKILDYVFQKLEKGNHRNNETLRLAALALSRLAARLEKGNNVLFIENLKKINFKEVVDQINNLREQSGGQRNPQLNCTLRYFLNLLENITSFEDIRKVLKCHELYQVMLQLYDDNIITYSKISLISILFNLNFTLDKPIKLEKTFLCRLYNTYKEELQHDEKTRRKIITIVVSASAHEDNHKDIIKSNFYTQFKRNINDQYSQLVEADEEVELFGLVNIVLNQSYMHLIYQDLKKIHKIALKNSKIAFKTKVDLFLECSKFLARISNSEEDEQVVPIQGGIGTLTALQRRANMSPQESIEASENDKNLKHTLDLEKDKSEMIDCCLKALLFSLIKIIGLLDTTNFSMFKYFMIAILDCSQNLSNHLIYLIKIENLIEFLKRVLKTDFKFNLSEFDDQVLNFSLRIIVCDIFFNLKQEKLFFKQPNIGEAILLIIKFAQSVIYKNIEKKMFLVSNTLRLLSQMITQMHNMPEHQNPELQKQQIEFVKAALTLSKDLQPCINIDALFCLTNMMNIKELAQHEALVKDNETIVNNALVIYFAYNHQVELDECIITFLYAISKYEHYQEFMKDKSKVLYLLMDRQLHKEGEASTDTSRQKIFSLFHNMTENEMICSQLNAKQFIKLTNSMFSHTNENKYQADHIHELALKSIINMCKSTQETFEEANLKEFLGNICGMYAKFKNLSRQYALRLVTILTKQWQVTKIQDFLKEIVDILSKFINNCESVIELKLVIMNLEKIASCKHLLKSLADLGESCETMIENIYKLIARTKERPEYHTSIEQLFRFCKKISKQHKAQEYLVRCKIHDSALTYITENLKLPQPKINETGLKQTLTTIQNIMKMIKNIFDGNITNEQKNDIFMKVTAKEEIITESDSLLLSYKNQDSKDELDEVAIIIVNIIICYNSISKKLDSERVKNWVTMFSDRVITASNKDFNKEEQARSWYMEKYVLIIELLVTKNLDKIDSGMTRKLLEIYQIKETKYFTNTIWYKLMKILAHLQNIQDFTNKNQIESIMQFILLAYEKAKENLCFFYFMKIVLLIFKKSNNNELLEQYPQYSQILAVCIQFLKDNHTVKNDSLILEIMLYIVDMFNFLTKFNLLHEKLNNADVMAHLVQMLEQHDNAFIMKSLTATLLEASKITAFYPDLLSENSLNVFLNKMLLYQGESDSLNNMFDCLRNIIQQTKTPIKYILSTSILKITEDSSIRWAEIQENNIYCLLKVLNYNIRFLNDEEEEVNKEDLSEIPLKNSSDKMPTAELLQELQTKALKYSIMAITNILFKTEKDLIFYKKLSILSILQENCKFEVDPQMNLRLLYLLNISLGKQHQREKLQHSKSVNQTAEDLLDDKDQEPIDGSAQDLEKQGDISNAPKEIQSQATVLLVNFLLENIFKFKGIIQFSDQNSSFAIDIPKHPRDETLDKNGSPSANAGFNTFAQHDEQKCSFFFEEESYALNIKNAMRLSLCLSLRILYILSVLKKKIACQAIADNKMSSDLFQFFQPYIEHKDKTGLKQIKQVVKIIQNCVEFQQLHAAILERDSVTSLINLADAAIKDEFTQIDAKYRTPAYIARAKELRAMGIVPAYLNTRGLETPSKNETQRKLIIPILRIFISLSQTDQFHWHLGQFNAQGLLNKIREKDDEIISEVAQDFSKNFLDHSNEGALNSTLGGQKQVSMAQRSSAINQDAPAVIIDFNLTQEVASLFQDENVARAANCVLNIEKLLIQKKIGLDQVSEDDFTKMISYMERVMKTYTATFRRKITADEEQNQHLRRLIIRSLLVSFNFIYTKKYLKETIDNYSQPIGIDLKSSKNDIFGKSKNIQLIPPCPIEKPDALRMLKDGLMSTIIEARKITENQMLLPAQTQAAASMGGVKNSRSQVAQATFQSLEGFTSFADFRDCAEELIYLFCSLAMSNAFDLNVLCGQVLPIGLQILQHGVVALKKTQESIQAEKTGESDQIKTNQQKITNVMSFQSINSILECIIIVLRNPDRNAQLMKKFDVAVIIQQICIILQIFEFEAQNDQAAKDQLDQKLSSVMTNLELAVKLMYYSPAPLRDNSLQLMVYLLRNHRFTKIGIFAVYCVALVLQDPASQSDCLANLIPVFADEKVLSVLIASLKDVDRKYKELQMVESKSVSKEKGADILTQYEQQTKANAAQGNRQLKAEATAKKEFEEAVAVRKNCLQILIVIVELLSGVMVQHEKVVLQLKEKEVQMPAQEKGKKTTQQVIQTAIKPKEYEKLVTMIYKEHDLLDVIFTNLLMRVPTKETQAQNHGKLVNYEPCGEETKLAARAMASMPFMILRRNNPPLYVEAEYVDSVFSVSGHFKALVKIIQNGYGGMEQKQAPYTNNPNLTRELERNIVADREKAKGATYFALFALLEFITQVPLRDRDEKSLVADHQAKLDQMSYGDLITCLSKTGLLQQVLTLPGQVNITKAEDETIVRLCMKIVIALMFKGQQMQNKPLMQFESSGEIAQSYRSIFEDSGVKDEAEVKDIMTKFTDLTKKLHHFEIGQLYQDSYVQYLHLLSQVTLNCSALEDQFDPNSFTNANTTFLVKNIEHMSEFCVKEDQKKKMMNADLQGQRTMLYQFFFMAYILSISTRHVILTAASQPDKMPQSDRSIAQRIYVILIKLLDAMSDPKLCQNLDESIIERMQVFEKTQEQLKKDQQEREGVADAQGSAKKNKKAPLKSGKGKNSATMTIVKLIMHNLEQLFTVSRQIQMNFLNDLTRNGYSVPDSRAEASAYQHKMQLIEVDESQVDLLTRLLVTNETHGEIVNKSYVIFSSMLEASAASSLCASNLAILDNSKALLQISIKHSSIYQCENAFTFLRRLVNLSDKYTNKSDIEASLSKIMPASMKNQ